MNEGIAFLTEINALQNRAQIASSYDPPCENTVRRQQSAVQKRGVTRTQHVGTCLPFFFYLGGCNLALYTISLSLLS